jgi:hypothetical protein
VRVACPRSQVAVLSVTDHFTREKLKSGATPKVFGMIFGTQDGRVVEICASTESVCTVVDGRAVVDRENFDMNCKLCMWARCPTPPRVARDSRASLSQTWMCFRGTSF